MGADNEQKNSFFRLADALYRIVDGPVVWFRKTIVEPNRQNYPWYHQKFRRVPTIDQCFTDDPICKFEANQQFKRDKAVDSEVLSILRKRFEDCVLYEGPDSKVRCAHIRQQYEEAETNWFIKYGDLGGYGDAEKALLKQKHRIIWERRHGPVGSGMKDNKSTPEFAE
ncbi:NADH dehydrogenase (ubiquinone) PDSW subunit [Rhodnius prolixus]|uniref:NADH dehydrogenase [ubiquinone] 1 beta subcomplex subunit 10 n=3 Tax=Rhodnius TaxID=13248 RepID=R4G7W4_RHOPR